MQNGTVVIKGTVHGNTIQLEHPSGLPDGQAVSVTVRPTLKNGDGFRQASGARDDADPSRTAKFGAGRGTLTILNEDDEHLKEFQEYME